MQRFEIRIGIMVALPILVLGASRGVAMAVPVFNPANFTGLMQVINYRNSPVGILPDSTSITNQYATLGVLHDGSTTTPPGPPGMSSISGLPGLESNAGDLDPNLPITVTFTRPVTQVGAYFLMGLATDTFTITALRANSSVIEAATVLPANMPLRPGPFGYNEGFVGLIVNEQIASVRFTPTSSPFVIDDLHFGVPEPSTLLMIGLAGIALAGRRPTKRRST